MAGISWNLKRVLRDVISADVILTDSLLEEKEFPFPDRTTRDRFELAK